MIDLVPLAGDPGGLARLLAGDRRNTVIPTAGTWLGAFFVATTPAGQGTPATGPRGRRGNPFCAARLGSLIDAGLYPGRPAHLTATWPDPDIYHAPAYWAGVVAGLPAHGPGPRTRGCADSLTRDDHHLRQGEIIRPNGVVHLPSHYGGSARSWISG